jgi:hypothetical protein
MALSTRTIRIIAASTLSLVLIVGAYAFSGPLPFLKTSLVNAQSTDTLLKAYANKDSDGDGLPDWQEVLYGTDPNNAHSVDPNLTDSQAVSKGLVKPKFTSAPVPESPQGTTTPVSAADIPGPNPAPGSLTDQFGQEFLQSYVKASNGKQLTSAQTQELINTLLASYSTKASKILLSPYTSLSIHVSPSTSISTYAASVENILRSNDVPANASQPLPLMQSFLQDNDKSAQKKLITLGAAYGEIAHDLLAAPVPPALADQHLALIQAFDTLSRATKAVTNYDNDPLAVLGSLSLYQPESQNIVAAFQSIAKAIIANGGEPATSTPGAMIVNIARSTQQQP